MWEIWGCCHVSWCRRGEAVEKREGGGLFESRPWHGSGCVGVLSIQVDYIKGQISGFVLHMCRPYDFF